MRIDYVPSEDRRSFSVVVRHRMDDQLYFTGGVDQPLEERLECC